MYRRTTSFEIDVMYASTMQISIALSIFLLICISRQSGLVQCLLVRKATYTNIVRCMVHKVVTNTNVFQIIVSLTSTLFSELYELHCEQVSVLYLESWVPTFQCSAVLLLFRSWFACVKGKVSFSLI